MIMHPKILNINYFENLTLADKNNTEKLHQFTMEEKEAYIYSVHSLHRTQDPEPPTILTAGTLSVQIIMLVCLSLAVTIVFHVPHCNRPLVLVLCAQLLPAMSVQTTIMKMNVRRGRRRIFMSILWKNQYL